LFFLARDFAQKTEMERALFFADGIGVLHSLSLSWEVEYKFRLKVAPARPIVRLGGAAQPCARHNPDFMHEDPTNSLCHSQPANLTMAHLGNILSAFPCADCTHNVIQAH
jgi:hypothetical protein